jgi:hypothetical protein
MLDQEREHLLHQIRDLRRACRAWMFVALGLAFALAVAVFLGTAMGYALQTKALEEREAERRMEAMMSHVRAVQEDLLQKKLQGLGLEDAEERARRTRTMEEAKEFFRRVGEEQERDRPGPDRP